VEQVELGLRRLVAEALEGDASKLPPHVLQKIEERLQLSMRRTPALELDQYETLAGKLEYSDLREIQDTITSRALWHVFEPRFGNKDRVVAKFDQFAELRNSLRHSRTVDEITRKEGEAAILWFERMLLS
jgi:hypothetical protein